MGRFGLKVDPVGENVCLTFKGRTYLGTIKHVYRREFPSAIMADVYHFNGELWNIGPVAVASLEWLERDWPGWLS